MTFTRAATPEERAADAKKRAAVIEEAFDRGIVSRRQYDEHLEELSGFEGYRRETSRPEA